MHDDNRVLTMSYKEREYSKILARIGKGKFTCSDAAESLGVTERHIFRLLARFRKDGDEGLIHRLRGSTSNRGYSRKIRTRVLDLYRERYSDYGPTLFAEKIASDHADQFPEIDHDTLRRWLLKSGLWSTARVRRAHRRKRDRRAKIGSLVQFDGSHHDWFEGRGPTCCLLVAIDDASSRVFMRFARSENTRDVLSTLMAYVRRFGVPREIYTDKAIIYHPPSRGDRLTDIGRALGRLGVKMILAHSPQAKGRVERSNRTHQDRLVKALRFHKISTIEAANRFLETSYIRDHNARFAHTEGLKDIHRSAAGIDLKNIFCFETTRTVYNDYTITLGAQFIQLNKLPGTKAAALPPPKQSVVVRVWLDDTLHIFWKGQELSFTRIDSKPRPIPRLRPGAMETHPWRHRPPIGPRGRLKLEREIRTALKEKENH